LADFNTFWRSTSGKNTTQTTLVLATSLYHCHYTTLWNAGYWACCWRVVWTFAACIRAWGG